ncbi:hypothetical protein BC833DRAFT_626112 [Globomyces pollinis-pini]|nr:hypothetical protein BC833DRAFT_626112 [Globomyces pollinis-pini]
MQFFNILLAAQAALAATVIQTPFGYVSPRDNGPDHGGVTLMPGIGPWEKVNIIGVGNGQVAITTWRGTYLSARDNGNVSQMPGLGPWEKWTQGNFQGKTYFQSWRGTYMSARGDKGHVAQAPAIGDWEKFDLINV